MVPMETSGTAAGVTAGGAIAAGCGSAAAVLSRFATLESFMAAGDVTPVAAAVSDGVAAVVDAGVAAVAAGGAFGALAYVIMRTGPAFPSIADYMVRNSYKLGGGNNVVNVILVDFRAFDTFGELTVILLASIGAYALLKRRMSK